MTTPQPNADADHRDAVDPVIRCHSVTREYRRNTGRSGLFRRGRTTPPVVAVSDVSLEVYPGEFVGISGPSGSGKSTLLHLLAGLDTPTAGGIEIAGTRVRELSERERARLRLDHVGIVFQRFYLLPALSARGNVALPLIEQGVGKRARRERATELLESVGLGDRLDHQPGELSGGEQQRVAIARALATDPDLLLADEPTGEVDSDTGAQLIELFGQFAEDRAVVVASHDEEILVAADRVVRLLDGRVVDDGRA